MKENRELIYLLFQVFGYMNVDDGTGIKTFKWSKELNKPIRIL